MGSSHSDDKVVQISHGETALGAAFFLSDDLPPMRKMRIQQNNDDIS